MKQLLLILIISISLMSYGKTIDKEQLQTRNGVYFETNQETPYTGEAIAYYENGKIKFKGSYKDGLRKGEWIAYNENGKIKAKANFKDGGKKGEWIAYNENGKIEGKGNYKDGGKKGEWVTYNETGKIEGKGNYKDGEKKVKELPITKMDVSKLKEILKMGK
ncbi:toxin-antitoxin system YwqK family antitoxin [Psychrilyobacter sp. S5]|uniref:toxin-antitoxin system YwqK family antitoxin n=1 Tax=Psychrilyobacter sp. S5 TaxID=2283384 RepID=UPI002175D8C0|nr:hypothetical protein [Psychrilyobacter sp. S5]MCS5421444.1 hypothetical protein [Psychrilyobacter sp. S5]